MPKKNSIFKKDPNWGGSGSAAQPIRNPDPGYPPRIKDKIQGQDRGRTAGGATARIEKTIIIRFYVVCPKGPVYF